MKQNLISAAPLSGFIVCFLLSCGLQAQRPNIIYIMSDDMGYADLSSYGQTKYATPNLDRLAAEGIKFTNAYAAAPICTPTRVAFMTGRYPARTPVGLMEPLTPSKRDSTIGLTPAYPSLPGLLKKVGYATALVGKWHLGFQQDQSPNNNGFDYFFGIHSGAADYVSHLGDSRTNDLYENEQLVTVPGYLTNLIAEKAVAFIKQPQAKPFFLSVMFTAPHWPWQAPGDAPYKDTVNFRAGGSPAKYAAMMKSMDDAVANILKALEEANLSANTLVIFTNDNGGERYSDNGKFTGGKPSLWEGGIRVPAFARWPGKIAPGSQTQQVAVTMDWTATILRTAGAKADPAFPLDGIDLTNILAGKDTLHERSLHWRTTHRSNHKAMRKGDWKYLQDEKGEYLFDLSTDEAEKNDLKTKAPEKFQSLKKEYETWQATVLAPIPL